jgi:hypothetical protein
MSILFLKKLNGNLFQLRPGGLTGRAQILPLLPSFGLIE